MKLLDAYLRLYESKKLYLANFCDRDTFLLLQPLGRAVARFGSYCACCSGTRVLAVAVLMFFFPMITSYALAIIFVLALVFEISAGPNHEETKDSP